MDPGTFIFLVMPRAALPPAQNRLALRIEAGERCQGD